MKHYCWLSLLLLTPLALGQAVPATSPARAGAKLTAVAQQGPRQEEDEAPAPKVPASQVPPTAAVITIQGLCSSPAAGKAGSAKTAAKPASPAGCKTVITRAQFEKLADALNPQMPLPTKRQLAEAYPRLLLFAQKARAMGLDKDPQFQEMMRFATLQLLAQNLTRNLQKKAGDISDAQIAKYYQDNPSRFQQVELLRIFIPKSKQHAPEAGAAAPPKVDTAADEAAMKTVAEKIHSGAAGGGDFQKLQQEAFEAAGIKSQSPNVTLGKLTREGLPTNHQKVFELQAGQVSELLDDPGGFYIYKVVSKQMVPLEQAKGEIRNLLQQQTFRQQMEAMIGSVKPDLNQAYFASPAQRGGATAPKLPPAGKPSAGKPGTPPQK
ncbi:MAG TPA: peptidylprolyl isomerase [Terriglobales bacterium]|nr:peptidylprolyl isomerase [Terriglobales bacterium]